MSGTLTGKETPRSKSSTWKPKPLMMGNSFSKTPQIKLQKSRSSRKSMTKEKKDHDTEQSTQSSSPGSGQAVQVPESAEEMPPRNPAGEGEELPQDASGLSTHISQERGLHSRQASFTSQFSNHSAKLQFSGPQFLLFGDIIHLQPITPPKGSTGARENMWKASFKFPDDFAEISLADDFISNHFPWHLEAALGWVCGQTPSESPSRASKTEGSAPRTVKGQI